MRYVCLFVAAVGIVAGPLPRPAAAVMQFYKAFVAEYVDSHPNPAYDRLVTREAKCLVCHQGRNRKHRNVYGQQLDKLLDKKTDAKNTEKIIAALKKVADMPADPRDPAGESFGQRIAAGKLPAGELEDLKQEPAEEGGVRGSGGGVQ